MPGAGSEETPRDLVLVGGGHAHVQVLRDLAAEPLPGCRLTVVVDTPRAVYSGMVPGYVAGRYRRHEIEIDIPALARRAGARVVLAAAEAVEPRPGTLRLAGRPALRFDLVSFNIGSTVAGLELPGVREHALPTRPIADLVRRVDELLAAAAARRDRPFRVVVVGGGAGGVELAFTLQARLAAVAATPIEVRLITAGDDLMEGSPRGLRRRLRRAARERGIEVETGRRVEAVEGSHLRLAEGGTRPYDSLVWVAGAAGRALFRRSGLPVDRGGFVWTRDTLQIEGHDHLLAAGDCATLREWPATPKAGVYAVRQGPVLTANLRALVAGRALRAYRPQRDFLTLLNLGDGTAVGAKWGLAFGGRWVMGLKDRIDRRFVRRFQDGSPA